jgi:hypothetical protein
MTAPEKKPTVFWSTIFRPNFGLSEWAIFLLFGVVVGCDQNQDFKNVSQNNSDSNPRALSSEENFGSADGDTNENQKKELVSKILDNSLDWESRKNAITKLKESNDWKSLSKTLPPNGQFDVISIKVLDAIVAIGDQDAIPALQAVENHEYPNTVWIDRKSVV